MIKVFIALLICFLTGCAGLQNCVIRTSFTPYTAIRYRPKSAHDRIIILSSLTLDRSYEEIGIIRVLPSPGCVRNGVSPDQYSEEQALIKKARDVGADAVIDIKAGAQGIETGTAIVFKDNK
jgi:hypothetical protein